MWTINPFLSVEIDRNLGATYIVPARSATSIMWLSKSMNGFPSKGSSLGGAGLTLVILFLGILIRKAS